MLGPLTTILGGWVGGVWVLDFARIKLTQPSLAGAGAELGNNISLSIKHPVGYVTYFITLYLDSVLHSRFCQIPCNI